MPGFHALGRTPLGRDKSNDQPLIITLRAGASPSTTVVLFSAGGGDPGTLAASEAADTAAFAGNVTWSGILSATEGADIAAFTGTAKTLGTLAAVEAPDIAAFAGLAGALGSLAAVEAPDIANFQASGPAGVMYASEAPDVAAFAGVIAYSGYLAATEAPDVALFLGPVAGTMAASEAPDIASFIGLNIGGGITTRPDPGCQDSGLFGWDSVYDNTTGVADWVLAGWDEPSNKGGLSNKASLATAVTIGLFTDKAVPPGHPLARWAGDDPRGWWGDGILDQDEKPLGSLLWLLERSVATEETRRWAEVFALDGLQPLLDSGACSNITATASILPMLNGIGLDIALYGQDGLAIYDRRFEMNWRQIQPTAIGRLST